MVSGLPLHIEDKKTVWFRKYRLKPCNSKGFSCFFFCRQNSAASHSVGAGRKRPSYPPKSSRAPFSTILNIFKNLFTEPVDNALGLTSKGFEGCLEQLHLKLFSYNCNFFRTCCNFFRTCCNFFRTKSTGGYPQSKMKQLSYISNLKIQVAFF